MKSYVFVSTEAQGALWDFSNHAGYHEDQDLLKYVEQLKCFFDLKQNKYLFCFGKWYAIRKMLNISIFTRDFWTPLCVLLI